MFKKPIITTAILIIALFLIVVILALVRSQKGNGGFFAPPQTTSIPSSASLNQGNIEATGVSPEDKSILPAGSQGVFTISFSAPVQANFVGIKLTATNTAVNNPSPTTEPTTFTLSNSNQTLTLTTKDPIGAYTNYELTIQSSGNTLLDAHYSTGPTQPSPAPSNNPSLQQYLPFETANYRLSYLPSRNTYVFNFIYNPDSSLTLPEQFDQAKADAAAFIQSKGIDPNSITIEWRHS